MNERPHPRWVVATVVGLVVMVTWTVVVKVFVPLLFALSLALSAEPGEAPQALHGAGVMWDFWPFTHLLLAAGLWWRHRFVWAYGVTLALAESAVIVTKFYLFLRAPEWTFWKLLWFTNKIYVLVFFLCLLYVLLGPGKRDLVEPAGNSDRGERS